MSDDPANDGVPPGDDPYQSQEWRDHFAAIGRVADSWSYLEFCVDQYTLMMLEIDSRAGYCLTSQISGIGRKLDAYIAAVRLRRMDDFNKELESFAKASVGLGEQRNRVIHDSWFPVSGGLARFEISARRTLKWGLIHVDSAEIIRLGSNILRHVEKFKDIHFRICAQLSTSQETPP